MNTFETHRGYFVYKIPACSMNIAILYMRKTQETKQTLHKPTFKVVCEAFNICVIFIILWYL